jgi:uncharacterized protein (DUF1015 family)
MLEVKGFRGLRYNPRTAGSLDLAVTPPYDVITPEQRAHLLAQNPCSIVRLVLPEQEAGLSKYEVAARDFHQWIDREILVQDKEDSIYVLQQAFSDEKGRALTRHGFLAVARLPEKGERYVLGHEQTFSGVIDDRFHLTTATRAHLEVIFVLYDDPANEIGAFLDQAKGRTPDLEANSIDGVRQQVWRVPEAGFPADFFREKTLYIADGHHRFGMACAYRDAMRQKEGATGPRPYDYVLMGFVAMQDPGLCIFPTHRLMKQPQGFDAAGFLKALEPWFDVARVENDLPARVDNAAGCAIGMAINGTGGFLLTLHEPRREELLRTQRGAAWRDLDVAVLHKGILERVMGAGPETEFSYERSALSALSAVERGDFDIAFILKATRAGQIRACAEAGENMPHKSTYFFPKMPSGAVIYPMF